MVLSREGIWLRFTNDRCISFLLLHNKCSGLIQQRHISSELYRSEVQPGVAGFSVQGHRAEIKVLAGLRSHLEALEDKAAFKFTQVVGRIQFHMVAELEALFLCWLPARGCSHLLQATHIPCHMVPSIFQFSGGTSDLLLCLKSLRTPPVSSQENPAFKGVVWLGQAHQVHSLSKSGV